MRKSSLSLSLAAAASLTALVGCGGTPAPIIPAETVKTPDQVTTPACDAKAYPCGPSVFYGTQSGDVIPNIAFVGRTTKGATAARIQMSDFYQSKDVKLLALLVAAEWCGPCNLEQGELVTAYADYKAKNAGVEFFEVLTESTDGSPADLATVDRWTKKGWTDQNTKKGGLSIGFPVAADPTYQVIPLGLTAYPTQILIQTSDMTIQMKTEGYGAGLHTLENNIDSLLNP